MIMKFIFNVKRKNSIIRPPGYLFKDSTPKVYLLFLNMFKALVQQGRDVVIGKRIIRKLPLSAIADKPHTPKKAQVIRDGSAPDPKHSGQVANTQLPM